MLSRRLRFTMIAAIVVVLAAAVVLADWIIALPPGRTATYVGRDTCAECHQAEVETWTGSDHDLAMDHANERTVLGDFDDARFTHVAFDQLPRLTDDALRALMGRTAAAQWAAALHGAKPEVAERLLGAMPEAMRKEVDRLRGSPVPVRPSDTTAAQQEIGDEARAMEREGKVTLDFAVHSRMFRRDGRFYVTTDNARGELETFEVKYVFGVRPLQQYLVEFPDGRVQCLPIAWNTQEKEWYHLYPGEPIPAGDELHWTGPLQNWNYMCAECHSTNLQKNYDLATNTYHTTWSEIDVSCETCHGPGSLHVDLARSKSFFWDRRYGYGLPNLKDPNSRVEIETCAPCHSRRRVVYPHWQGGQPYLDHYLNEVYDSNLYYADGQILDEDYVYGSFIQSRMYHNQVRCTDCHDPHSTKVKFPDNRLCGQCHTPAKYDTPTHHHHPDASQPGTLCVDCHMPETTYMVCDARRDHSLRIPRPDLTVDLGIPNACNLCHNDLDKGETPQWAAEQCDAWYGERKEPQHFAYAVDAGRKGEPAAVGMLTEVARRKTIWAPVRATVILLLGQFGPEAAKSAGYAGLKDPEPLVRTSAVRALEALPPEDVFARIVPLLHDPVRSVRSEAVRTVVLARIGRENLSQSDQEAFDRALDEYLAGQDAVGDQPGAHLNRAVIFENLGDTDRALDEYAIALRLDAAFVPARLNRAMLFDRLGRKAEAETELRAVIASHPEMADAHYALGLLVAEDAARLAEAAEHLGQAARLAPASPRIHYNYGLALQQLGRPDEAEAALRKAYALQPSVDSLHALALLYLQQGETDKARQCARGLLQMEPHNRQWQALLERMGP